MWRGRAFGLLVAWLLGAVSALLGVALAGVWYEYRLVGERSASRFVNTEGWQIVQVIPANRQMGFVEDSVYLRRPRLRLP